MRKGQVVKTKSGKKGFVYNDDPTANNKVKVHIVNDQYQETGEKLLCSPESLTLVGFKD